MNKDWKDISVGVIGAGVMGKNHVRVCADNLGAAFQGLYDPDPKRSQDMCKLHGCSSHENLDHLLEKCRAVIIAAPTSLHMEIGSKCLERGIDVLIEKPLADNPNNAEALVRLADQKGRVLMVGHIERYNQAICALMNEVSQSSERVVAIGAIRLAPFDGSRCMDMDVLYDLLIHDIDLVLEIAASPVKRVMASGQSLFSDRMDNIQALVEFENSVSATLWAARCSPHKAREITVTTRSRLLKANTLNNTLISCMAPQIPDMDQGICSMGLGENTMVQLMEKEPLLHELEDFLKAVLKRDQPVTNGQRALEAMKVLELIYKAV